MCYKAWSFIMCTLNLAQIASYIISGAQQGEKHVLNTHTFVTMRSAPVSVDTDVKVGSSRWKRAGGSSFLLRSPNLKSYATARVWPPL